MPTAAVMSQDASLVAAQGEQDVVVWETATGKVVRVLTADPFFRGSVTRGALVVVREQGMEAYRGPTLARKVPLRAPKVLAMGRTSISEDGSVAASIYPRDGGIGDPDTVGLYDTNSGRRLAEVKLRAGERVQGAVLSGDGKVVAVYGDIKAEKALLEVHRVLGGVRGTALSFRHVAADLKTTYSAALSRDAALLALGAGERLLLFDLAKKKLLRQADTNTIKALFPAALQGDSVQMPGCHQMAFSQDGKRLASLHAFGVVGAALWSVDSLRPTAWIKRHADGGTMRQLSWDGDGQLWLISATYSPDVWLHAPKGDRFVTVKVLRPPGK